MKVAGFLLLLAGWLLVLSAIALLPPSLARGVFLGSGLAIEVFGLILACRAHLTAKDSA